MYLLDTNIVSYWMRGDTCVIRRIKTHAPADLFVSTITLAEILYGIEKSPVKKEERIEKIQKIQSVLGMYTFDESAAGKYAVIRARLEREDRMISERDTQIASIADGVDGGLARLKNKSSQFGGLLDAVLDRYADAAIVLGMTMWSLANETYPAIWLAGFAAIVGTLTVSYSRARVSPEHRSFFDKGLASLASRDIRLFLIMLGGITGQVYFCLLVIACLTHGVVFYRLVYAYRLMARTGPAERRPAVRQQVLTDNAIVQDKIEDERTV